MAKAKKEANTDKVADEEAVAKKPAKRTTAKAKPATDSPEPAPTPTAPESKTAEEAEDKLTKPVKAGPKARRAAKEVAETEEPAAPKTSRAKKGPAPRVRPMIERRSKNYRKASELIEKDKTYELKEAVELATKTSPVKFDATVELHVRLGVDPRQADQNIRGNVVLPSGTGKTVRVAVFAPADQQAGAKSAGADLVGDEEIIALLDKEQLDFDLLIATPQTMPRLGKYARLLGPKGLMPNPKSGTVTADVAKAVKEAKAGRVEYRVDGTGIVHIAIGKVSFGAPKLLPNAEAMLNSIRSSKPASVKGIYVLSITVTTTMGPPIPVTV